MNTYLQNYTPWLAIVTFLIVIWQFFRIHRLDTVRKHFYSVGLKKNLENVITEQDHGIAEIQQHLKNLDSQISDIITINKNNFQKVGFVKFSPFGEAGNLSFALVLLNDHNSGVAISSLHTSANNRVYSREIKNGKGVGKLTTEELEALKIAMDQHGA